MRKWPGNGMRFLAGHDTALIVLTYLFFGTALFALSSCAYFGPGALEGSRGPYNISIQKTNDEQMLLNLVRLKYRDTPFFLEVSSVATQFTIKPSASIGGFVGERSPGNIGLGGGIEYEEKPTVTYAPLHGDEFVRRMLSPIPLDTLLLLYYSGWSVERVLRVAVNRLNMVNNAPRASGPTPDTAPEYKEFQRVAQILRGLQLKNQMDMGYEKIGEETHLVLRIDPQAFDLPETKELLRLLDLSPGKASYPISPHSVSGRDQIGIMTRSLMGVLFFLSQGVRVPPEDEAMGMVTVTYDETGAVFDWDKVTGNLFGVSSQATRPSRAAVAIQYRGHWFYIDDTDLASKSTFSLLAQLFSLQSGKVPSVQLLYTLPLGG